MRAPRGTRVRAPKRRPTPALAGAVRGAGRAVLPTLSGSHPSGPAGRCILFVFSSGRSCFTPSHLPPWPPPSQPPPPALAVGGESPHPDFPAKRILPGGREAEMWGGGPSLCSQRLAIVFPPRAFRT